jgi:hypothetical protein
LPKLVALPLWQRNLGILLLSALPPTTAKRRSGYPRRSQPPRRHHHRRQALHLLHLAHIAQKAVLYPLIDDDGITITRGYPLDPAPANASTIPTTPAFGSTTATSTASISGITPTPSSRKTAPRWAPFSTPKSSPQKAARSRRVSRRVSLDRRNNKPILNQTTRYIFTRRNHARVIDQLVTLKALDRAVFNDDKEGLLGMRVARWLESPDEKGGVFMDANGNPTKVDATAPIRPAPNPATGVYTSPAKASGRRSLGNPRPLVRSHRPHRRHRQHRHHRPPKEPGYPTYWHARGYGLFAANPLGNEADRFAAEYSVE